MASVAKTIPQDLPPKGGYAPYQIDRTKLRSLMSGRTAILGYLAVTTASSYVYFLTYKQITREKVEMRSARIAMFPLLLAERDRAFLKQMNANRREEAELMKDVPGWEVGTWYGEPIYKSVPKDQYILPTIAEYYAHTSFKDFMNRNRRGHSKYICERTEEHEMGSRSENCSQVHPTFEVSGPVSENSQNWHTVTHDTFTVSPKDCPNTTGRRRELVKKLLNQRVYEDAVRESSTATTEPVVICPSEYNDKFCDDNFTSFMDRIEYNDRKHTKFPLYGGTVQTYYKSQIDKGTLKARSEICNLNQPFRRTCSFTTPPDQANREPNGGF